MESLGLAILCMWSMGGMFLLYKLNCKLIKEERRKENEEMNRDRKYKKNEEA